MDNVSLCMPSEKFSQHDPSLVFWIFIAFFKILGKENTLHVIHATSCYSINTLYMWYK